VVVGAIAAVGAGTVAAPSDVVELPQPAAASDVATVSRAMERVADFMSCLLGVEVR
jgi:hypothetical protein